MGPPAMQISAVAASPRKSLMHRVLSRFVSPAHRELPPHLAMQRECVLSLSHQKFDNCSELHTKGLDMLYRCCTGNPCPGRFGGHWEAIGFQVCCRFCMLANERGLPTLLAS
jgi:hypothetical protein